MRPPSKSLPLSIFWVVIALWFWGGMSYRWSIYPLAGIFGDIDHLENVFAPVSALFSALSIFGLAYTLYLQFTFSKAQSEEMEIQRFEETFFNMLNLHVKNRDDLIFDESLYYEISDYRGAVGGKEAIKQYYELFAGISIGVISEVEMPFAKRKLFSKISAAVNYAIMQFSDDGETIDEESAFKQIFNVFDEITENAMGAYYRHLYHLIRYTSDNAQGDRVCVYMRIIRAQFTPYEVALFYYNGLLFEDYHEGITQDARRVTKFQKMIEDHALLHHLNMGYIFDRGLAGVYDSRAYGSK